jgi:hypothetical protein
MHRNTQPIPAHIDSKKLDQFLHNYVNAILPGGSISTILTTAFQALLQAGVVVLDDGTSPSHLQIHVHGGRVTLAQGDPQDGNSVDTFWIGNPPGSLPPFDEQITALAQLLVAVLGSPPWPGKFDFPHTRN